MNKDNLFNQLEGALIVSCQAEEGFPLNTPEHLAAMAQSAVIGGAVAIRASGPQNIRAIRKVIDVPIIGIYKKDYAGFDVRITPTMAEVEDIVHAGCAIIALDATQRPRPGEQDFAQLYASIREKFNTFIMADISTFEEGVYAAQLGVDIVSTTLSGYTEYSTQQAEPDIELVRRLAAEVDIPVIAEGRIRTPNDVRMTLDAGAFAVVIGSMITRPHLITQYFLTGIHTDISQRTVYSLDIGGTKIAGGIVSGSGEIMLSVEVSTPDKGGPAILEEAVKLLGSLKKKQDSLTPEAVGISTGGQIDRQGQIIGATKMIPNWSGFPLKKEISARIGLPTFILNDGHAAALAEFRLGMGLGYQSMLCVVIGTGLGGGLVIDGKLAYGNHGLAGSLGQMKFHVSNQGFIPLEELVSGPGLVRLYNQRVLNNQPAESGLEVAQRAESRDEAALAAIDEIGNLLGLALSHALHTYDVECVVVGGSVSQIGDPLFDSARSSLKSHGHTTIADTPIFQAKFGPQAGLVGAALYAFEKLQL